MIKSELVQRISLQNPHLYQRDVENILNAILGEIIAAMARGDRVELRAKVAGARLRKPCRAPPSALPQPGGDAAYHDAADHACEQQLEQGHRERKGGARRVERIKRHGHRMAIGHREGDEHDGDGHEQERGYDLADDDLPVSLAPDGPSVRSRAADEGGSTRATTRALPGPGD